MRNNPENIAVVDIGSNSVRLFIFRVDDGRAVQISAQKFFCGLGRDLGTTGSLNPEAVALTHKALASFREEIQRHDIMSEIVIGTAALREAKDAQDFISDVKTTSGFNIKIIEGEEEARLAALAIISFDRHASGIVADFGGGSLELARIGHGKIESKISLKLGAHYLKALTDRKSVIDAELQGIIAIYPEFSGAETLYIIGGSWRSLAKALLQDKGQSDVKLEGFKFPPAELLSFCADCQKKEPKELVERYHMEDQRAELMDVSALMLERAIHNLNPKQIKVSTAGIRDGLSYDYILSRKT